jgi:hypothetical protein
MSEPIAPIAPVAGLTLPAATLPAPASPAAGGSLFDQSLQALQQAAHAPDAVGRGVRADVPRAGAPALQLVQQLTDNVLVRPVTAGPAPLLPEEAAGPLGESSLQGLQRVSEFAIQTSVQLASESTMLSVTSALASAANTTFHQLLSSNE